MNTVFMFSGQGSQYYQMAGKLYATDATFQSHLQQLDALVRSMQGVSVIDMLYNDGRRMVDPFVKLSLTHPAIFMIECAMVKVLEREGIVPDYVLGCSLGEYTAAVLAGVLTEEDALTLILQKASMIERTCAPGGMVAVLHDERIFHEEPALHQHSSVAAMNAPSQFVIAGTQQQLAGAQQFMKEKEILHQELMVGYGFHDAAIDPAGTAFCSILSNYSMKSPLLPLISCAYASALQQVPDNYLWEVTRRPVQFRQTIDMLEQTPGGSDGFLYIDLGPSGSLANLIKYNVKPTSLSKGFQILTPFQQEQKKLAELKKFHKEHTKKAAPVRPAKKERLLAYVFPGQGSQKRGMGEELFDRFPEQTEKAGNILGYSVKDLCIQDPGRLLNKTQYTQPALFVVNALSYLQLKEDTGMLPDFVAGHSLGEYNALFAAGGIDFETGLRLVQKRGALMAGMQEGGMAAVKGLSEASIRAVIEHHGLQAMDIANLNTQNQIVLSGPRELIAKCGSFFEDAGASLYFPLNVSGAFHSRYMQPAREAFEIFLQAFQFHPLQLPVVSNVEAAFYEERNIRNLLGSQLTQPVRWVESIQFLSAFGNVQFKEVGPGDVLTKLVYSIQNSLQPVV